MKLGNDGYIHTETHAREAPSSIFLGVYYEHEEYLRFRVHFVAKGHEE